MYTCKTDDMPAYVKQSCIAHCGDHPRGTIVDWSTEKTDDPCHEEVNAWLESRGVPEDCAVLIAFAQRKMIDILIEDIRAAIEELLEERGYSAQNLTVDLPKGKEIILKIKTGLQVDKDGELVPVNEESEEDFDREDFEPLVDDEFEVDE